MVDCGVAGFAGALGDTGDLGASGHRYCYAPAKALDNTKKTQSQNKQQTQHKPFIASTLASFACLSLFSLSLARSFFSVNHVLRPCKREFAGLQWLRQNKMVIMAQWWLGCNAKARQVQQNNELLNKSM